MQRIEMKIKKKEKEGKHLYFVSVGGVHVNVVVFHGSTKEEDLHPTLCFPCPLP